MAAKKLSDNQTRMLKNVRDWGDPFRSVHGASAHGGAALTEMSLRRKGLLEHVKVNGEWEWKLTPAGEAAVAELPPASPPYNPSEDFSISMETLRLNGMSSGIIVSADKRYVKAYRTAETAIVSTPGALVPREELPVDVKTDWLKEANRLAAARAGRDA